MSPVSAHEPGIKFGEGDHEPIAVASAAGKEARTMPSAAALAASHLYKSYGKRCVGDDVCLHVEKGEVVGLLGANGAGKTTTFYMIIGLERPD